jgi:pentatricopeptide repeat protein
MTARGAVPDVISYNAAISGCARAREWQRAVALLERMEKRGIEPTVISYNTAISACAKGGQWRRAIKLLGKMEKRGLTPDAISYSSAICACEESKRWREALSLLERMEGRGLTPPVGTYTAVMQTLVSASQHDAGVALLERVHASPHVANSYPTHFVLLNACRHAGDAHRADFVQATMDRLGLKKTLNARVTAAVGPPTRRKELHFINGPTYGREGARRNEALHSLYGRVQRSTAYKPQLAALPFAFTRRSSEAEQVDSLKFHAEKKALAELLLRGADDLEMRVNIKVCADCHHFLAHAAKLLGRPIRVLEPSRQHVFDGKGGCSCGGESYADVGPRYRGVVRRARPQGSRAQQTTASASDP